MKKLSVLLSAMIMLFMSACSGSGYDAARARELASIQGWNEQEAREALDIYEAATNEVLSRFNSLADKAISAGDASIFTNELRKMESEYPDLQTIYRGLRRSRSILSVPEQKRFKAIRERANNEMEYIESRLEERFGDNLDL